MFDSYRKVVKKKVVFRNEIFLGSYLHDGENNVLYASVVRRKDNAILCPRQYAINRGILRCPPGEYLLKPYGMNSKTYKKLFTNLMLMYRNRELHSLEVGPRIELKDESGKICRVSPHFAVRRYPGDVLIYVRSSDKESKASFYKRRLLFAYAGKNVIKIYAGRESPALEAYSDSAGFIY